MSAGNEDYVGRERRKCRPGKKKMSAGNEENVGREYKLCRPGINAVSAGIQPALVNCFCFYAWKLNQIFVYIIGQPFKFF